jgi:hypothetical protein
MKECNSTEQTCLGGWLDLAQAAMIDKQKRERQKFDQVPSDQRYRKNAATR